MGTLLHGLTSLSPLQQDELGGLEVADAPCPRHKGSQAGASPMPTATLALVSLHQEGGNDTRVALK